MERRSAQRGPPSPSPALPLDLVQHCFRIKGPEGDSVVPLDQRVRCFLVCKAWRAALDPGALPLGVLHIPSAADCRPSLPRNSWTRRALPLAEWVSHVGPTAEAARVMLPDEPPSAPVVEAAYNALLSRQPRTVSAAHAGLYLLRLCACALAALQGRPPLVSLALRCALQALRDVTLDTTPDTMRRYSCRHGAATGTWAHHLVHTCLHSQGGSAEPVTKAMASCGRLTDAETAAWLYVNAGLCCLPVLQVPASAAPLPPAVQFGPHGV